MKEYFVCIMTGRTGTLYVGMTSNLLKRVYQHKEGVYERFTKKYGVNRLVYFERYNDP